MSKQIGLRPIDIPVALLLTEKPEATYDTLAIDLGISSSTAHQAVARLSLAGILYPGERKVNLSALLEFLEHGIKYAFPAMMQKGEVRGVPTAYAAPALSSEIVSGDAIVWPETSGSIVGEAIEPLYKQAVTLPERSPNVYKMLTLVDSLRVGRARERNLAKQKLREHFGRRVAPSHV